MFLESKTGETKTRRFTLPQYVVYTALNHKRASHVLHTWSRVEKADGWMGEPAGSQVWNHHNSLDISCHDCSPKRELAKSSFLLH